MMEHAAYLIVDRRGSEVDLAGDSLTVERPDERPVHVPLRRVHTLVVIGSVRVNARVITKLGAQGGGVIMIPGRGRRAGISMWGLGHGNVVRRIGQYRLVTSAEGLHWASRIVRIRIAGARRLLGAMLRLRPDKRRTLTVARSRLALARANAPTAQSLDALLGVEGSAAAAFYSAYASAFPPSVAFRGRNRRPPRDPVNAALSLGYTLLQHDALRAATAAGLDPSMGFLHTPAYGRDSLACDLAEIGRANVERMVWRLFAEQKLRAADFTHDGGACLLGKGGRGRFFAEYARAAELHVRSIRRTARVLATQCDAAGSDSPSRS